jgi:hypothetical protein
VRGLVFPAKSLWLGSDSSVVPEHKGPAIPDHAICAVSKKVMNLCWTYNVQ